MCSCAMITMIKILGILSLLLETSFVLVSAGHCGRKLKMKEYRGYYYTYPTPNGDDDDCGDDSVSSPKMSMMRSMSMSRGKKQDYYPKTEGYFIFPLYTLGQAPSANLTILALEGDPDPLVREYTGQSGVLSAVSFSNGAPFFVGQELIIPVFVTDLFSHVTIAAKALNTNDAFVALNGVVIQPGDSFTVPAYDAGSEENNELCTQITGPACALVPGKVRTSGNGEGVVHVARGIHGIGNLSAAVYDWRNPMMSVNVE